MSITLKKITDRPTRPVNITEWTDDAKAFVKELTVRERLVFNDCFRKYTDESLSDLERSEAILSAIVMVLVGEDGQPLFKLDNVPELNQCSFEPVTRIILMVVNPESVDESFVKN
ncbi:MAG: hypothetical protein IJH68_00615 [Thermoguttaceae bacterium]|nr:hypothetical protein [Thermoguttaceae bacterium]